MQEQKVTIDRIDVLPDTGNIQVRERISILEDGVEVESKNHRYGLERGTSLEGQPEEVAAVARAAWGL